MSRFECQDIRKVEKLFYQSSCHIFFQSNVYPLLMRLLIHVECLLFGTLWVKMQPWLATLKDAFVSSVLCRPACMTFTFTFAFWQRRCAGRMMETLADWPPSLSGALKRIRSSEEAQVLEQWWLLPQMGSCVNKSLSSFFLQEIEVVFLFSVVFALTPAR